MSALKENFCFNSTCEMYEYKVRPNISSIYVRGEGLSHIEVRRHAWVTKNSENLVMLCDCCTEAARMVR